MGHNSSGVSNIIWIGHASSVKGVKYERSSKVPGPGGTRFSKEEYPCAFSSHVIQCSSGPGATTDFCTSFKDPTWTPFMLRRLLYNWRKG